MVLKVGIGDIEDSAARRVPTDSKCIVRIGTAAVDDVVREVLFTKAKLHLLCVTLKQKKQTYIILQAIRIHV